MNWLFVLHLAVDEDKRRLYNVDDRIHGLQAFFSNNKSSAERLRTFLLEIWRSDRSTLGIFVYSPHFDAGLDFLDKSHFYLYL
jgi:hypothetical protein